jgi:hypothetical protein
LHYPTSFVILKESKKTTNHGAKQMQVTQKRAAKGGQFGVNGEFYEGGKFLPSTQKGKGKARKKTGKREIEPYKWEVQPTPEHEAIWGKISGFCQWDGDVLTINDNAKFDGENYFYPGYASIEATVLNRLIKMFNNGIRWIDF